ncbi:MAG: hypothetical protein IPP36_05900 [Nitrosomonadales bacterium]|nr:hypothetical protein [Nitrosomonadales bacterium]
MVLYKGSVVSSSWNKGSDAISALLMHDSIINEYVLDTATLSGTDWVITMPTKHYNVPCITHHWRRTPQLFSPFTSKFWVDGASRSGVELIILHYWDRKEKRNFGCWRTVVLSWETTL